VYDPRTIQYMIELFGPRQLAVGSDFPFIVQELPPGKALGQVTTLSPEDRQAITTDNALRFLGVAATVS